MNSPLKNDGLTLTSAEFRMFADLIRKHAGLDFDESSRFLLERRLGLPPTTIASAIAVTDSMNFQISLMS
jgi:hypothetical protein